MSLDYDIVIATRNRAPALSLSIPLMLAQSRQPSRLIVVDSSDDPEPSRAAVEAASDASPCETTFIASPAGTSLQRNTGLEHVRAPVVMFPDDDSLWFKGVAEAVMQVYERDTENVIGAVCAAASPEPPPGVLEQAKTAYRMNIIDRVRERLGVHRAKLERTLFPDPFVIHGRSRWDALGVPGWLAEMNAVPVEWMTGFRMSFRTDAIRRVGFDEALGRYSLFEDTDASFGVMRDQLVAGARDARVYHYKVPGPRGDGRVMGAMQLLNRAYVVCKHAEPGSLARRRLKRYGRYKLLQYLPGVRTGFGRARFAGARAALAQISSLTKSDPAGLQAAYLRARSAGLLDREG